MKKYKILVIQHLLKNNELANSGEEVDGAKFINLQHSLDGGYCELVKEPEDKPLKEMKKSELIALAKEKEIEIDDKLKKNDILDILEELLEEELEE